jgi:hypothetical protein
VLMCYPFVVDFIKFLSLAFVFLATIETDITSANLDRNPEKKRKREK